MFKHGVLIRFRQASSGIYAAAFSAFIMAQVEEKRPVYKSFSGIAFAFPMRQRAFIPILLWFCVIAVAWSAHGQVVANWTGKGNDSLWTTAKNWDTHSVPGSNDTAN